MSQKGCQWVHARTQGVSKRGVAVSKTGVSRARGDWKLGDACEELTLGSYVLTLVCNLDLGFCLRVRTRKNLTTNIRSCLLLVSLFYMAMAMGSLKRGGGFDLVFVLMICFQSSLGDCTWG